MASINKIRKCYSCGAILQCDDPSKEGYVKKETLENPNQNFLFCDKCFEAERYKVRLDEPALDPDILTIINDAKEKNGLIVYIVNLYSFEAAFNHQINEMINGMNILVVANKFDLLPKGSNIDLTAEYVAHRFRASGVDIKSDRVMVVSALNDESAREVMTRIYELKNHHNIYIIGSKNSGKRTIFDALLKVYNNISNDNIVTIEFPGTNSLVNRVPITSKTYMYHTPSISIDNSILNYLSPTETKKLYVVDPLKPYKIAISKGQAIYIGGLGIVELVSGNKTILNMFFHKKMQYKRVKVNGDLEDQFIKTVNRQYISPTIHYVSTVKDLDVYDVVINEKQKRDIGIQGLGWITFIADNQQFRLYVPKKVSIYHSRSKVTIK